MRVPHILALIGIAALVSYPSIRLAETPAPSHAALPSAHPDDAGKTTESIAANDQPETVPDAPALVDWDSPIDPQVVRVSNAAVFAYWKNHPPTPLPPRVFAALTSAASADGDVTGTITDAAATPAVDVDLPALTTPSREGLCSTIVSVARANQLPIPFFANLIWQESNFRLGSISSAGALGIAQFMPETASDHGLINPFEPVHALFSAGRLLRKLKDQYGNLGVAAAAYNAGPQRVKDWLAERKGLPGETRAYVVRITGQAADRWMTGEIEHDPQAWVMPARAPCAEVVEAVKEQAHHARIATLMVELADATLPPPISLDAVPLPRPAPRAKPQPQVIASGMKDQSRPAFAHPPSKREALRARPSTLAVR